jgi:hypothetical protein
VEAPTTKVVRRSSTFRDLLAVVGGIALFGLAARNDAAGDPMSRLLLIWIVLVASVLWLLSMIHELGHALVAVAVTGQRVLLQNGAEDSLIRFAVGRIDFHLDPRRGRAYCQLSSSGLTPRQWLAISVSGPAATLMASAAMAAVAMLNARPASLHWALVLIALLAALDCVGNLVPRPASEKRPFASDGWNVRAMIKLWRTPAWRQPMRRNSVPQNPLAVADRFSEPALTVLGLALTEAREVQSGTLSTAHLLVGLTVGGRTNRVLSGAGISRHSIRALSPEPSQESGPEEGNLPPSDRLVATFRAAAGLLSLTHAAEIAPDHLLYALVREPGTDAARIVERLGADLEHLRDAARAALLASAC